MSYSDFGNRFQRTTPVVLNLIIANTIGFIAELLFGGVNGPASDFFALHYYRSDQFHFYQVISYMFMHASWTHLFFNMFGLWMFGSIVERVWGPKRFLIFYFACGIGAAIVQLAAFAVHFHPYDNLVLDSEDMQNYMIVLRQYSALGASGAIMGVLAAFGYLFPNTEMMIIPVPVPVKAKWVVLAIILIDLFSGLSPTAGDNVGHWAHVGGAATGFLIVFFQNRLNRKTFY